MMAEPGHTRQVGYCTNVHAGVTLEAMLANMRTYAPAIREHLGEPGPLPVGLWLSRDVLDEVLADGVESLRDSLGMIGVDVFTFNGFPFGNFHDRVVKHDVYTPNWSKAERLTYTIELAKVLTQLVPPGSTTGLSTLPIGWGDLDETERTAAATHLQAAVSALAELEARTGTCIHVDIEPEPGCLLERSADVVAFFEDHLLVSAQEDVLRRHLRVCHDVCHAAVMFETQQEAIATYDAAGISIGKVQVSSALQGFGNSAELKKDLLAFAEPRWLHQASIQTPTGIDFHEDLSHALETHPGSEDDCWRVHFHVPVHELTLGSLSTTQVDLVEAIDLLANREEITAWEVETYAWDALPERFGMDDLAAGIAAEIAWTRRQLEHAS